MAFRAFTAALLLTAISILQFHAIAFWQSHTGSLGWMWALGIEGAAVWLWWQPQRLVRAIGLIASVLSLVGPLHQVGYPIVQEIQLAETADATRLALLDVLRGTLNDEKESLRQYQDLASKRLGWAGRIDQAQERIDKSNEELRTLMSERPSGGLAWGLLIVGMEVLALIVLQVVVVLAVRTLATAGQAPEVTEEPVDDKPIPLEPPAMTEVTHEPLDESLHDLPIPERLQKHLEVTGDSVSTWAKKNGVNVDRARQVLADRAPDEVVQQVARALSS